MDRLSERKSNGGPFMDFGMCKNGWSGSEYNHLEREQFDKLEYSGDNKPGGTWDSRYQKRSLQGVSLLPLLFVIIMIPLSLILREMATNSRKKDDRSAAIYGSTIWKE